MYFQFLIEDLSTEILINHVIEKLKAKYPDREIYADTKSFKGIGHLATHGNLMERKGGNLLNNLHMYLRGFDRSLASMKQAAIIVVLDNDKRDPEVFRQELENVAKETVKLTDCVFCVAVKEMEAWLLGDENAIWEAYPSAKKKFLRDYEQDGICDTWQILANTVYPGGLSELQKKSQNRYSEIGKAKCEWADKIGVNLVLEENISPSFRFFINEFEMRIASE